MAGNKQKSKNRDWVSKRVDHILRSNPDMDKGKAFAVAWNECFASGECKGKRPAKSKKTQKSIYKKPESAYNKKADPKRKKSELLAELVILADMLDRKGHYKIAEFITGVLKIIAETKLE
jgi:hypothetical protein